MTSYHRPRLSCLALKATVSLNAERDPSKPSRLLFTEDTAFLQTCTVSCMFRPSGQSILNLTKTCSGHIKSHNQNKKGGEKKEIILIIGQLQLLVTL